MRVRALGLGFLLFSFAKLSCFLSLLTGVFLLYAFTFSSCSLRHRSFIVLLLLLSGCQYSNAVYPMSTGELVSRFLMVPRSSAIDEGSTECCKEIRFFLECWIVEDARHAFSRSKRRWSKRGSRGRIYRQRKKEKEQKR
ncbi:hypothetical protein F5I97DRAFT_1836531 [Phlebopus sp. FC_14]|nr:hypothetical protein F5I97DRAFT_1836531 [Phlebopus sp. FC_14]